MKKCIKRDEKTERTGKNIKPIGKEHPIQIPNEHVLVGFPLARQLLILGSWMRL